MAKSTKNPKKPVKIYEVLCDNNLEWEDAATYSEGLYFSRESAEKRKERLERDYDPDDWLEEPTFYITERIVNA